MSRHQEQLEHYFQEALARLEVAYENVLKTQPVGRDTEKLKLLIELTREQVKNENTDNSTRQTR